MQYGILNHKHDSLIYSWKEPITAVDVIPAGASQATSFPLKLKEIGAGQQSNTHSYRCTVVIWPLSEKKR